MNNVKARIIMNVAAIYPPYGCQFMTLRVDGVDYGEQGVCYPKLFPKHWDVEIHDGSWYCLFNDVPDYKKVSGYWLESVWLLEVLVDGHPKLIMSREHIGIPTGRYDCSPWYFDFAALEIPPIIGKIGVRNMPV